MPPCGYRDNAIDGMDHFLRDNLAYFIDLYEPQGLTPAAAMQLELREIGLIRSGSRGGSWSAATVEINNVFYKALAARSPQSWAEVATIGQDIIHQARLDLASLGQHTSSAA